MNGIMRIGLSIILVAFSDYAYSSVLYSCNYDLRIALYGRQYLPQVEPNWFKAQFYQESLLDNKAVSPVGAMGLAQIMPGTFRDIRRELGWSSNLSPFDPTISIEAGIYYDRKMWNFWKSKRTWESRLKLMFASYNAGAGNLFKAQKLSGYKAEYDQIIAYLPKVTKHHSKETISYVNRIFNWKSKLDLRKHKCY